MRNMMKLASRSVLYGAVMLAALHNLQASETKRALIASAHSHGLLVSIVNDSGRLIAGSNTFCLDFTRVTNAEPVAVKDVEIEFAQQVGRIRERPIRARIAESAIGHFCGNVDLGIQFYQPAFYYACIRYTDAQGVRRKCVLTLAIEHT